MIISFDIMNENDYKKTFIDPPISTVHCGLSPTCFARRKEREISICQRNCSQGSCSYFDLPQVP